MRPWLFHIGNFGVPGYWALLLIGFTIAIWFTWREARRDDVDAGHILDLNLILLVAGILGARLMHVLMEEDPLRPGTSILYHYLEHPGEILALWNGLAFYGGLIASVPLGVWFVRRRKLGVGRVADIYAVAIPLGLVFGRLGCFLAGCCHGSPTDLAVSVTFTDFHSLARPLNTPLHPTQLYAAGFGLILFFVLLWTKRRRRRFEGQIFLYFVALYSAGRFLLEFLRNDNRGMFFDGMLSSSQLLAIPLLLGSLVMLWLLARRLRAKSESEQA